MDRDYLKIHSADLKKMPFTTPEGYFEKTTEDIRRKVITQSEHSLWDKIMPYASMAAAFIIMVMGGTFLLEKSTQSDEMTYEDYIVHSDFHISTDYSLQEENDMNVEEEDIINYLIYTGITAEAIELSK